MASVNSKVAMKRYSCKRSKTDMVLNTIEAFKVFFMKIVCKNVSQSLPQFYIVHTLPRTSVDDYLLNRESELTRSCRSHP